MKAPRLGRALVLAGLLVIWFEGLLVDASHGIFKADAFADRAVTSLGDPQVAAWAADRITTAVIQQRPNLIAVRPLLLGTTSSLIQSEPFRAVARQALRTAHASVFSEGSKQVLLSVPDVGILLRSALAGASPELAAKIPDQIEAAAAGLERNRAGALLVEAQTLWSRVKWLTRILIFVGPLLLIAGIRVFPDRRKGLVRTGVGLVVAGLLLALLVPLGRLVAVYAVPAGGLARGAFFGLWRAYFLGLFGWAITLAGCGLVLAAAGSSLQDSADPFARIRGIAKAALEPPPSRGGRALWALALAACGTIVLIWPSSVVVATAVVGGLLLLYAAVWEFFCLVLEGVPVTESAAATGSGVAWRRLTVSLGLAGALVAAIILWRRPTRVVAASGEITSCNGSALLCDRRVDQVVFPGAHNAMSNAEAEGWLFPHHTRGIPAMLQEGIRALLIDVHYGLKADNGVKTDIDLETASREKIEKAIGPEGVAAAMRIRDRIVVGEGEKPALYFCHGFCELGAYPVGPTLQAIHDFMVENPDQVVVLVIEDYVTPEELAKAFTDAGLLNLVYTSGVTGAWPTLRQLILTNQRLIVFTESGKPGVPWLYPTLGTIQETPYTFHKIEDFSCRTNRGGDTGALFQINHWIETTPAPRPSNAAIVNAYDFLLARARQCQKERRHLPNLIAVDFYDTGDILRVARTLNGLPDSTFAVR
jgi:hypothetical protein